MAGDMQDPRPNVVNELPQLHDTDHVPLDECDGRWEGSADGGQLADEVVATMPRMSGAGERPCSGR
jgi:hypothetical protein